MKAPATTAPAAQKTALSRPLTIVLIVVLAIALARALFSHHASKEETIAREVTVALQKNDVAGVRRYQNAETATQVTASRVGRGADTLGPLGALKSVRQTAGDSSTRVYQFDVTFDKAHVHETIKFDPDEKIVRFRYDDPIPNS